MGKLEQRLHPWAQEPTTVAALAATYLAILAAATNDEDDDGAEALLEHGAMKAFIRFLDERDTALQHAGLVALSFVSAHDGCAEAMLAADVPNRLVPLLEKGSEWPRSTAALVLRNLFVFAAEAKRQFVSRHGLHGFVALLAETNDDLLTDALLNLLDILETDGQDDHAMVEELLRCDPRLVARVGALLGSPCDDVATHAETVREKLTRRERGHYQ